jgi:hypothetical protein
MTNPLKMAVTEIIQLTNHYERGVFVEFFADSPLQTNACSGPPRKKMCCDFYSIEIRMAEMIPLIGPVY